MEETMGQNFGVWGTGRKSPISLAAENRLRYQPSQRPASGFYDQAGTWGLQSLLLVLKVGPFATLWH